MFRYNLVILLDINFCYEKFDGLGPSKSTLSPANLGSAQLLNLMVTYLTTKYSISGIYTPLCMGIKKKKKKICFAVSLVILDKKNSLSKEIL